MRFLVLALMIALLPLRGWAGEVMATEMASSQLVRTYEEANKRSDSATEFVAAHAHKQGISATFEGQKTAFEASKEQFEGNQPESVSMHDCEGHAKADVGAPADARGDSCSSCQICQVCHTVALSTAAVNLTPTFSSRTLPRPAAAQFASATSALGQKPPIS
jgi:hypothetical protein